MSTIATSRLTTRYQAVIPEEVRRLLHLEAGDEVSFEAGEGAVLVRKVEPRQSRRPDATFTAALEGTLGEWASEIDEEAYGDL